jgi:hypothetical protein
MNVTQKENKTTSLQEKLDVPQDVDKCVSACISLVQVELSRSPVSTVVRNHHVIEGNGNQCGWILSSSVTYVFNFR